MLLQALKLQGTKPEISDRVFMFRVCCAAIGITPKVQVFGLLLYSSRAYKSQSRVQWNHSSPKHAPSAYGCDFRNERGSRGSPKEKMSQPDLGRGISQSQNATQNMSRHLLSSPYCIFFSSDRRTPINMAHIIIE